MKKTLNKKETILKKNSMNEEKPTPLKHQIRGIELLDASLNAPKEALAPDTTFHFNINLEHRVNTEKEIIQVICTTGVYNEAKDRLLGQMRTGCMFWIENLAAYVDPQTKATSLPNNFVKTLNSIAISTARGVMFSTFRGTFLHNAVLPLIDPASFTPGKK